MQTLLCGAGGQDAPPTPGRRHGQPAQQLPAMPEQHTVMDMSQWPTGQPVGWPLGPRTQQPYPAVSVSSVGSVMQAFRGLNVHVSPLHHTPSSYHLVQQCNGMCAKCTVTRFRLTRFRGVFRA